MSRPVLLQTLLDRIRSRCDSRALRQTNAILTDWINEAVCELWEKVSDANPKWRFQAFPTIDIVLGTQDYAIPDACFRVARIDMLLEGGDWIPMNNCPFMEVQFITSNIGSRSGVRYCLNGDRVYLDCPPGWSQLGGLKFWGTPVPAQYDPLLPATSVLDFIHGWDRWVLNKIIVEWSQSDKKVVDAALALLGKAEADVISAATRKDIGQGDRLRLVDQGGGLGALRRARAHPWD